MIIFAPNINSGGGLILLESVIENQTFGLVTTLYIDSRCPLENLLVKNIRVIKVSANLIARLKAELELKQLCHKNSTAQVLFFGNLPPFVRIKNESILFLQNAYLLKNISLPRNWRQRLRYIYEKARFYHFLPNVDKILVQTSWMKNSLSAYTSTPIEITKIVPTLPSPDPTTNKRFDLICITGPEEHKNLPLLIESLENYPKSLSVCIVAHANIHISNKNIKLTHFKKVKRAKIYELYKASKAILILSNFESFCLPLHEALHFKIDIIYLRREYIEFKHDMHYGIESPTLHNVIKVINEWHNEQARK